MSETVQMLGTYRPTAHERQAAPHGTGAALRVDVLGPLRLRWEGGADVIDLGPPQRRALLLRLLVADACPVSVERLCDDLWEGAPPAAAASSVQAHISRLRSTLNASRPGPGATMLTREATGYVLRLPAEGRDSTLFAATTDRARGYFTAGRTRQALREVEAALALWRGEPFYDAQGRRFAQGESYRMRELRSHAEELRARVLYAEGDYARAVAAAEDVVGRDPLRESSWAVLLHALYASGRAAEALRRFETVRRTLPDEVGMDPGPELRRAHESILRHEVLGAPGPAPTASASAPVRLRTAPGPAAVPARDSGHRPAGHSHPHEHVRRPVRAAIPRTGAGTHLTDDLRGLLDTVAAKAGMGGDGTHFLNVLGRRSPTALAHALLTAAASAPEASEEAAEAAGADSPGRADAVRHGTVVPLRAAAGAPLAAVVSLHGYRWHRADAQSRMATGTPARRQRGRSRRRVNADSR
ncbi:BTAD domain-containing putative transcriptional regulator [Streptomyces sp. NPDC057806]|uniref:AfsR/SARP family transcriptional regulator n=1 Tax=Streptomyces sp. NPDC057806 TaxID=3346255 RepID=UPI00367A6B0F